MNSKKSLLLFTIGPVQSFIIAARKTNDLLAGSLLLSKIASVAIKKVHDEGGKIIFPYITNMADISNNPSIPNRFLAEVPTDRAEEIANKAEKAVIDKENSTGFIHQIAQKYKKAVEDSSFADNPHWNEEWKNQTNAFWEIYWSLIELPEDESLVVKDYGKYYNELENSIGFRKTCRDFVPLMQTGMKCSLFPSFSAVYPHNHQNNYGDAKAFFEDKMQGRKNNYKYNEGEALSSIAIIKREMSDSFPSTVNLANGYFNKYVIEKAVFDPEYNKLVSDFLSAYKTIESVLKVPNSSSYKSIRKLTNGNQTLADFLKIDNSFLMTDIKTIEFLNKTVEKEDIKLTNQEYNTYTNALKQLLKNTDYSPRTYYAVVYFDGDEMGKWLSGSHKNEKGEFLKITPQLHNRISEYLTKFASQDVPKIVEDDNIAKLLFSGGDDVIAFTPLESLLKLIKDIHSAFADTMFNASEKFLKGTGSFGVCIGHYNHALSDVLKEARAAEHYAKSVLGRNAFAITLLKHSGEKDTCGAKFDTGYDIIAFMEHFLDLLKKEYLSNSFLYSLIQNISDFPEDGLEHKMFLSILNLELKQHKNKNIENESQLNKETDEFSKSFSKLLGNGYSVNKLISLLKTVQFISRGGN